MHKWPLTTEQQAQLQAYTSRVHPRHMPDQVPGPACAPVRTLSQALPERTVPPVRRASITDYSTRGWPTLVGDPYWGYRYSDEPFDYSVIK